MTMVRSKARMTFTKAVVARVTKEGIKCRYNARQLYQDALAHGSVPDEIMLHDSLIYGPTLMLRPIADKSTQSLVKTEWKIKSGGIFQDQWDLLTKVPGWHDINVYSFYGSKDFWIHNSGSGSPRLNQNQGFTMTLWIPPTNPQKIDPDATFEKIYIYIGDSTYGSGGNNRIFITWDFKKKMWYITHSDVANPTIDNSWAVIDSPGKSEEGFLRTTLTVIPYKQELMIGLGDLQGNISKWISVQLPPDKYDYSPGKDKFGNPIIEAWGRQGSNIDIAGSGKFMFTFGAVQYPYGDNGSFSLYTGVSVPGYSPSIRDKESNGYLPRLEMDETFIGCAWPEYIDAEDQAKWSGSGGYRIKCTLFGLKDASDPNYDANYNQYTPFLDNIEISSPRTYASSSGSGNTIVTDCVKIEEYASASFRGEYESGGVEASIWAIGPNNYYKVGGRNHKYRLQIGTDTIAFKNRGYYSIDRKEVSIPSYNQGYLSISASSQVVKRCKNTQFGKLEAFDGDYHYEAMQKLADLANVEIDIEGYGDSTPKLPEPKGRGITGGYESNKMWKPSRSDNVWDYMKVIRDFSGFILYPDRNKERLIYKKRPPLGAPVYTFRGSKPLDNPLSDDLYVSNITFSQIDNYRTRVIVMGKANHNSTFQGPVPGWPFASVISNYDKFDNISAKYADTALEKDLGETRWCFYHSPQIGNYAALAYATNAIAKWVTRQSTIVNFDVEEAENILDLQLWDTISIFPLNGATIGMPPSYQVIDYRYVITPDKITANITGMSI